MSESGARPRILFATDLSRSAERAEAYACTLAASWGATLTVMSVLEFPPGLDPEYPVNRMYLAELMKEATQGLVELKERTVARGAVVQTRIATGIPSEEVLAAAGAEGTDLIVVGTVGKTGVEHVLLGSTAERIIRTAPCPVLAIRMERSRTEQDGGKQPPVEIKRLLVPIDFSDCSLDAVEYAVIVAQRAKASLTLLHVLEPVSYGLDFSFPHPDKRERQREAIKSRLDGLVSSLASAQVKAGYLLRGGLPNDSILEAARTGSADMIVMGTHGRRGLSHAFYGSVAESVLRKSHCPVLTVRSPKFHPDHRRVLAAQPIFQ
ncbi:MAG: universal stress protein [Nitrospira sp.]|nr:universal stress protein [Nitrospira sp.]